MREHILALLRRYLPGELKPSGESHVATKCPFHKGGEERKPSFGINVDLGVFNCLSCHETGTIRTLLQKLGLNRSQLDAELQIIQPVIEKQAQHYRLEKQNQFSNRDPFKADFVLNEPILGVYDFCPDKLIEDGFSPDILRELEVGYDRSNNRIMYPVRDLYGNLAGFVGGVTSLSKSQYPKYKVYEGRRKSFDGRYLPSDFGEWFDKKYPDYSFGNHDFLWHFDQVYAATIGMSDPATTVYVVEGFKACLWMMQCGFKNTVALMGSYISDRQQQMLHRLGCTITLCLDNDNAGQKATLNIGDLLWRPMYGRIKVMPYPKEDDDESTQPDDYEPWLVQEMINQSKPYLDYVNSRRRGNLW